MSFNVVLLGPPGVGKGSVSEKLTKKLQIPQISTGELLRAEIAAQTGLGKKVKEIVESGRYVPDELVAELVKKRLSEKDCEKGFILDGYPRNINQAKTLDKILKELGKKLDLVLNLVASEPTIIERLSNRRQCNKCGKLFNLKFVPPKKEGVCDECGGKLIQREDDKPETIKKRLSVFKEQTQPLIEFYRKRNLVKEVDCSGTVEENVEIIMKVLKDLK